MQHGTLQDPRVAHRLKTQARQCHSTSYGSLRPQSRKPRTTHVTTPEAAAATQLAPMTSQFVAHSATQRQPRTELVHVPLQCRQHTSRTRTPSPHAEHRACSPLALRQAGAGAHIHKPTICEGSAKLQLLQWLASQLCVLRRHITHLPAPKPGNTCRRTVHRY